MISCQKIFFPIGKKISFKGAAKIVNLRMQEGMQTYILIKKTKVPRKRT